MVFTITENRSGDVTHHKAAKLYHWSYCHQNTTVGVCYLHGPGPWILTLYQDLLLTPGSVACCTNTGEGWGHDILSLTSVDVWSVDHGLSSRHWAVHLSDVSFVPISTYNVQKSEATPPDVHLMSRHVIACDEFYRPFRKFSEIFLWHFTPHT